MTFQMHIGRIGEERAVRHLERQKYKILERNVRKKWGELDIIALARDKTLVFVEVKTTQGWNPEGIQPEEQMTPGKRRRFERAASLYAGAHHELVDDRRGYRLDLIAVFLIGAGEDQHYIRHYENI